MTACFLPLFVPLAAHAQEVTPDTFTSQVSTEDFSVSTLMNRVERPDEELLIFELKIGKILISDAIIAYEDFDTANYHVPLSDFFDAVEFPITVNNDAGTAKGWAVREDNSFALSLPDGTVSLNGKTKALTKDQVEKHDDGIYVSLKALEQWFPITVDVDFNNLALVISSLETLPIENKFERDKARGDIRTKGTVARSENLLTKPDAPRFTLPFFDTSLQSSFTNQDDALNSLSARYSVTARSIILGQDAEYTLNDQTGDGDSPDLRLTLGRKAFEGDTLFAGLTEYQLGDVTTVNLPLIAGSNAGRGLFFTNISPFQNGLGGSNTITLRGELAVGYQVDIKRNGELLAFIDEPDENGEYLFDDLFVLSGLNVFELVFYGPQGQETVEERRVFVPDNPVTEGAFEYRVNAIQDNTNLFTDRDNENDDTGEARFTAEASYGLSKLSAVRAGLATYSLDGERQEFASLGLNTSWRGLRFDATQAFSSEGTGSSLRVESAFKGLRWQAMHQYYNDFVSEENESSGLSGDLEHETDFRVSGILPFLFLKNTPLTLEASRLSNVSGDEQYEWSLRATKNIDRIRLTGEIDQVIPALSETRTDLNLQVSSRFNDFTLRGTAQYSLEPEMALESINLTSDITLDDITKLRLGLSRSGSEDPLHGVTVGINRDLGFAQVGFNTTYDDDSNFTALLSASFGFAYNSLRGEPYFSSKSLANSSGLFARTYRDLDADNIIDDDEEFISDVSFTLTGNKRDFKTKDDGLVFIPELRSFDRSTVDIQENTFPNPFMKSRPTSVDFQMRPSQTHVRNYPVILTGEVDGEIFILKRGTKGAASSIILDVLRDDESLVTAGKSEFDGFILIQDIPTGNYVVAPNKEQIDELGYCPVAAQPIRLSEDEPFYSLEHQFILHPHPELIERNRWLILDQDIPVPEAVALRDIAYEFPEEEKEEEAVITEPTIRNEHSDVLDALLQEKKAPKIQPQYLLPNKDDPTLFSVVSGPYEDLGAIQICDLLKENEYMCEEIVVLPCEALESLDINRSIAADPAVVDSAAQDAINVVEFSTDN